MPAKKPLYKLSKPHFKLNLLRDKFAVPKSGIIKGRNPHFFENVEYHYGMALDPVTYGVADRMLVGVAKYARMRYGCANNYDSYPVAIKEINFYGDPSRNPVKHMITTSLESMGRPQTPETIAGVYNKVIDDLLTAGVPLPPMRAVAKGSKVVIYSKFFGASDRSHLTKRYDLESLTKIQLNQLVDIWAKTMNAGYVPTPDFVEHNTVLGGFVPIDIDLQVISWLGSRKNDQNLVDDVQWLFRFISFRSNKRLFAQELINKIIKKLKSGTIRDIFVAEAKTF